MQETPQPALGPGPSPLKCREIAPLQVCEGRQGRQELNCCIGKAETPEGWLSVSHSAHRNTCHLSLIYDYPTHFRKSCLFFQDINFSDLRVIFNPVCSQMPGMLLLPMEHAAPGERLALVGHRRMRTQGQAPTKPPAPLSSA